MNTPTRRAISAYVQTGIESAVPEADAHQLVEMLYEGAVAAVADARIKLEGGDIPGRGHAISKAISIVDSGLRGSLNLGQGGELASSLEALYQYISSRLLQANLKADARALEEASTLLTRLQGAWVDIGRPETAAAL